MARAAFLLYVDDWLSSGRIELMDAVEERGYFRLLMRAWKQPDCGLPTDGATLAAWSKMGPQWFRETAEKALRIPGKTSGQKVLECFVESEGRLFNDRQIREWNYQQEVLEKRQASGKKGGRPKANGNQTVNQTETERLSEDKPNGKQKETNSVSGLGLSTSVSKESNKSVMPKWTLDEHYQQFAEIAREFWKDLIDEDLSGWYWGWTNLDPDQRQAVIQNVRDRIEAGQDFSKAFKPTFFSRSEWKRPIGKPAASDDRRTVGRLQTASVIGMMSPGGPR